MKKTALLLVAMLLALSVCAREPRRIFTNAYNALPEGTFKVGAKWLPLPDYADRAAWDKLTAPYRDYLILAGEKSLKVDVKAIPATKYIQYAKDHDRKFLNPEATYRGMMMNLALAELAEGKGRFIPKLIDIMYYYCEKATWNFAEHVQYQSKKGCLPDPKEKIITLLSANAGQLFAFAWYFFHEEFNKVYPNVAEILYDGIEENILKPYLDKSKQRFGQDHGSGHWWLCFNLDPNSKSVYNKINNWNPYCNTFCLQAFLCTCRDQKMLDEAIAQAVRSIDIFMDYVNYDGLCEEGTGYWYMAGKKAYDFAKCLYYASNGKFNVFDDPQMRNMGEWRSDIYIGDGWSVDIADGFARGNDYPEDVYRCGKDMNSKTMKDLAIYLHTEEGRNEFVEPKMDGDFFERLEQMLYTPQLMADERAALNEYKGDFAAMRKGLRASVKSSYYPDGQVAYLRNDAGWVATGKAGNNGESHNHNDLGSGMLYIDSCPVIIDPGVSTYGPRFFEGMKYANWNRESDWHTTPSPNGVRQTKSRDYYTENPRFDAKANSFCCDIAKAYKPDSKCEKWVRTYTLGKASLDISDDFTLNQRVAADTCFFVTPGEVALPGEKVGSYTVKAGEVVLTVHSFDRQRSFNVKMTYSKALTPEREILSLRDPRFTSMWGAKLERIKLVSAPKAPAKGKYAFKFTRL